MSRALWYFAGLVWLSASGAGLAALWRYSLQPAELRTARPGWPAESGLRREAGKFNLVMFLHPQCPCSRASLGEMGNLLAHSGGSLAAQVVFFAPEKAEEPSSGGPLRSLAAEIPGLACREDHTGGEAGLFGAEASGETFVYDPAGALVFHGGITLARGHAGENDSRLAVEALVNHEPPPPGLLVPADSPGSSPQVAGGVVLSSVFGCALREPAAPAAVKEGEGSAE